MSETEHYKVEERDGKWVVVFAETGDVRGTHDTKEDAEAQCKLLNEIANEPSWDNEGE